MIQKFQNNSTNTNLIIKLLTYGPALYLVCLVLLDKITHTDPGNYQANLELWKTNRDLFYKAYAMFFFYAGLSKARNNTDNSISKHIPAMVTSMILTTFSYVISGLLIDLFYLSGFIIKNL